jgi:hypothetical protein
MGLAVWIGIGVPVISVDVLFERRPLHLILINAGFLFVVCVISGALHSLWR